MFGLLFLFTVTEHERREILKSRVVKESDNVLRLEETKTTRSHGALLLELELKPAHRKSSKCAFACDFSLLKRLFEGQGSQGRSAIQQNVPRLSLNYRTLRKLRPQKWRASAVERHFGCLFLLRRPRSRGSALLLLADEEIKIFLFILSEPSLQGSNSRCV